MRACVCGVSIIINYNSSLNLKFTKAAQHQKFRKINIGKSKWVFEFQPASQSMCMYQRMACGVCEFRVRKSSPFYQAPSNLNQFNANFIARACYQCYDSWTECSVTVKNKLHFKIEFHSKFNFNKFAEWFKKCWKRFCDQ